MEEGDISMDNQSDWSDQLSRLLKNAKSLTLIGQRIQEIVDSILSNFETVSIAVDDIVEDYDSLLNADIKQLIADNTPAALLALELEKLPEQSQADLKAKVEKMFHTHQQIQDIYAVINDKVNVIRTCCEDYLKNKNDVTANTADMEAPSVLSLKYPELAFIVLSPRLRNLIQHTKGTYVSFLKGLQAGEEHMNKTVQNEANGPTDKNPAWMLKEHMMKAQSYTNLVIYGYENVLNVLYYLQAEIRYYQNHKLENLTKICSILPTLEAITLAIQVFQPSGSTEQKCRG